MTFSILVQDQKTGTLGAAAATGSLCVGGWVLRGSLDAGLVASQGTAPSTLWRDRALHSMRSGMDAISALSSVVSDDFGREHRQASTLDLAGRSSAFTGDQSVAWAGHLTEPNLVCSGNMLAGPNILQAMVSGYKSCEGETPDRLVAALRAAEDSGGDSRGLLSAALMVLSPDAPPIDLRIDYSERPIAALSTLLERVRMAPYADWLHEVPVARDPMRAPTLLSDPVSIASEN